MGFLGKTVKKIKIALKKNFSYEEDAQRVDIRIESLADWLYKITLKDSSDLKILGSGFYEEVFKLGKKISIVLDSIKVKQLVDNSISRYKLEVLEKNRNSYIKKVNSLIKTFTKKPNSIMGYRSFFEVLNKDLKGTKTEVLRNKENLKDVFGTEILKIDNLFDEIGTVLLKFSSSFKSSNNDKVNSCIKLIKDINQNSIEVDLCEKEITEIELSIKKTRNRIYKLSEKVDLFKLSTRFKEVLQKEKKLSSLFENRDKVVNKLSEELSKIEIVLFQFAQKTRDEELAKEYVNHLSQAFVHDSDHKILELITGLIKELNNKRTKIRKSLSDEDVESYLETLAWLNENMNSELIALNTIDSKINQFKSSMRNYIIINEIEDNESRMTFYQNKLKNLLSERNDLILKIAEINLLNLRDKLRKDLLILTGYDVNVIYNKE